MAEPNNNPIPTPVHTGSILNVRDAVTSTKALVDALAMALDAVEMAPVQENAVATLVDLIGQRLCDVDKMLEGRRAA